MNSQELRKIGKYKIDDDRTRSNIYQVSQGMLKKTAYTGTLPKEKKYKEFIPQVVGEEEGFTILQPVKPLVGEDGKLLIRLTEELITKIDEQVNAMHRKFIHGNLRAKNILVGTGLDVFFINYENEYDLDGSFTWEQEINLRKKGFATLQEYAQTDYNLWRRDLDLDQIKKEEKINDSYHLRFISTLQPVKDFSDLFVRFYGNLAELWVTEEKYYFVKVKTDLRTFYLDSTGIYQDKKGFDTVLEKLGFAINNSPVKFASKERAPPVTDKIKALITEAKKELVKYSGERLSKIQTKDLDLTEIDYLYSSKGFMRKRLGRYEQVNISDYVLDKKSLLKLKDIEDITKIKPLELSFLFVDESLDLGSLVAVVQGSFLDKNSIPLMKFCLKNNPKWFGTLLMYAVPQYGKLGITYPEENLVWFYQLLSSNIEGSLLVLLKLKERWNILYSYLIILLKCFEYIENPTKKDILFAEMLIGNCTRSKFYDILLYYLQSSKLRNKIIKMVPELESIKTGGKNIRHYPLELAIPGGTRCRKTYPLPVGLDKATPKKKFSSFDFSLNHHTLPQAAEEGIKPTENDYKVLIKEHLTDLPIVALMNDPNFDKKLLVLKDIREYNRNVITDILFCFGGYLDQKKLDAFPELNTKNLSEVVQAVKDLYHLK